MDLRNIGKGRLQLLAEQREVGASEDHGVDLASARPVEHWLDRGADLSPVDFALGWGPMSDDRVQTRIVTAGGELAFQEYFVRERWAPVQARDVAASLVIASLDAKSGTTVIESADIGRGNPGHF